RTRRYDRYRARTSAATGPTVLIDCLQRNRHRPCARRARVGAIFSELRSAAPAGCCVEFRYVVVASECERMACERPSLRERVRVLTESLCDRVGRDGDRLGGALVNGAPHGRATGAGLALEVGRVARVGLWGRGGSFRRALRERGHRAEDRG